MGKQVAEGTDVSSRNVVPPEDLEEDLSMEELEEVDGLFFGQWKDAAVCVDR